MVELGLTPPLVGMLLASAMNRLGTSCDRLKASVTDACGSAPIRAVPSRCHPHIGARPKSRTLLAPVYGWFTSGHNTADLIQARAVLDSIK